MDHCAHETQHSTRALKALEGRPLLVEGVEQLRVDWVGPFDAVLVGTVASLAWEVVRVLPIQLDVRSSGRADGGESAGVSLLEQALPDDVVGLDRGSRPPLFGDTTHHVLQALE